MAVFTITINDPVFEKKSSEVAYLERVLDIVKAEIGRGRGTVTSGIITGTNQAGVANSSLGSWSYMASGTKP
jgi:hypothetical protein